jgi:hypothetical protein
VSNPFMTSSWSLRFELPVDKSKGRDWSRSLSATVICDTAERAAEIIREAHADAVIYAINHKGRDVTYADPLTMASIHFAKADGKCPKNRHGYQEHQPNDHGRCAFCAAVLARNAEPAPGVSTPQAGNGKDGST